jgi:hypothetical protein
MEKIPAVARNPTMTGKLLFQISIPENKESSAHTAENATERSRYSQMAQLREAK